MNCLQNLRLLELSLKALLRSKARKKVKPPSENHTRKNSIFLFPLLFPFKRVFFPVFKTLFFAKAFSAPPTQELLRGFVSRAKRFASLQKFSGGARAWVLVDDRWLVSSVFFPKQWLH